MPLPISMFTKGLVITSGAIAGATAAGWYWKGPKEPEGPNDNDGLNQKIKSLGISNGQCLLSNGQTSKECELNLEQMNLIKFYDKNEGQAYPIGGLDGGKKVKLRIEKDYMSDYTDGIRFTFTNKNKNDVTLGSEEGQRKTLKTNVEYDYKIYKNTSNGGIELMKAWTLQILGGKVGLNVTDSEQNTCEIENSTVNVWKKEGDYVVGATVNKKCFMNVEKDIAGYPEGFKFVLKENEDEVELSGGTKSNGATVDKLKKNGVSYEIGPRSVGETKNWFLIERA